MGIFFILEIPELLGELMMQILVLIGLLVVLLLLGILLLLGLAVLALVLMPGIMFMEMPVQLLMKIMLVL
jgi:hypothetical protein|uniref:Uncharacterized protein n=1 Tax=Picea glauca TaxID=3330 RepID=A0A101LVD3_PICGL|nr:hypothetical protein ABT39_MTgene2147 [Picea glauca]